MRRILTFAFCIVLCGAAAYGVSHYSTSAANAAAVPPGGGTGTPDDTDGDTVSNDADLCLGTLYDPLPKENHYSWLGGSFFMTTDPKTKTLIQSEYSIAETNGCSCAQILEQKPGGNDGEGKYGCTQGTMENEINGTWE